MQLILNDVSYVYLWWFYLLILSTITSPTTFIIFNRFFDGGWGFSKILSLIIISYTAFLLFTFKLLSFSRLNLIFIISLFATINLYIFYKYKKSVTSILSKKLKAIIFQEILFATGLFAWSFVRGHQANIEGLEKFMDFGFINSILNSKYLPPTDMWFSGMPINYYWFGHYFTAFLIKLTNIPSDIGYNIMLATILGFCLTGAFSIITSLTQTLTKVKARYIILAGLLSAILLNFAGNFHTPYYVYKDGQDKYWYPDATRFIGYNPDTNDKTIHEFPQYSYVVADLHGHLLNLPIVILYIACLWIFFENYKIKKKFNIPIRLVLLSFILNIMFMTSTWDFGNYTILSTVCFLTLFFIHKKSINNFIKITIQGSVLVIMGIIFTLPFLTNFESIAQGISFVNARSPLSQLLILWGFPLVLSIIALLILVKTYKTKSKSDFFISSLLITSLILIILPEIIYVKDIYIASHHRANTMFKLTYQAFVMSYLASGYIIIRSINLINKTYLKLIVIAFYSLILSAILMYPKFTIKSYYGKIQLNNYQGLLGYKWLIEQSPDEYKAINWLKQNASGQSTILEAPGDSYTTFNVISSYTGYPTVSGWFVHEWLWRGDPSFPQKRVADINNIYTSKDVNLVKSLLAKYKVDYVIIGPHEIEKYSYIDKSTLSTIADIVFSANTLEIYKVRI